MVVGGCCHPDAMTDPFENPDPEWLRSLSPADRERFEELRAMSPEERVRFMGHIKIMSAAWRFLDPAIRDGELVKAWRAADPDFRLALAQQWLIDNAEDVDADGVDRDEAASGLSADQPTHWLWDDFERVHLRSWQRLVPDPDVWGIGTGTRLLAPDIEVLYVHDSSDLDADGVLPPGDVRRVVPLVMRRGGDDEWRVLNLGSEVQAEPGWPPRL